ISNIQFTGNDGASLVQAAELDAAEDLTLADKFEEGESYSFNVDINGTSYTFDNVGSLNDIVSQVNAQSNETGIEAHLNAKNDEIFFSSQFGEPFTVDIRADLDGDGTFDPATETVNQVEGTVEDDTSTVNDIDISTREGADIAMISVDYAIDTINGFRAQLGAVQNRFESTIQNLSTTSENLSASNSRIRDADFAAETAELARTQVLQSAGLSVLSQANARPQQVLQLLQG
ncbi:flagellin, partial [Marinobacter sp.]|uniref:flagellin n=1 Tax=Marinobacter sp. TaxID=50741 RepID=UPI0035670A8D